MREAVIKLTASGATGAVSSENKRRSSAVRFLETIELGSRDAGARRRAFPARVLNTLPFS
jgi:hypothetical protein